MCVTPILPTKFQVSRRRNEKKKKKKKKKKKYRFSRWPPPPRRSPLIFDRTDFSYFSNEQITPMLSTKFHASWLVDAEEAAKTKILGLQ